jgi:hypothetical protein
MFTLVKTNVSNKNIFRQYLHKRNVGLLQQTFLINH